MEADSAQTFRRWCESGKIRFFKNFAEAKSKQLYRCIGYVFHAAAKGDDVVAALTLRTKPTL